MAPTTPHFEASPVSLDLPERSTDVVVRLVMAVVSVIALGFIASHAAIVAWLVGATAAAVASVFLIEWMLHRVGAAPRSAEVPGHFDV